MYTARHLAMVFGATAVVMTGLFVEVGPAAAAPGDFRLYPDEQLGPGQKLVSQNGLVTLQMQEDGDLVETIDGHGEVWSTGGRQAGSILRMQADGNLVVIAPGNNPVWETGTTGHQHAVLDVQGDGNVVVYGTGHVALWDSAQHGGVQVDLSQTPQRTKYLALGDSFSSGEGIEPFYQPDDPCHRSQKAYSTFVQIPGQPGTVVLQAQRQGSQDVQWGFLACSGAQTTHQGSHTIGLDDEIATDPTAADPKNDLALPLDADTTLVTLTIGGNNVDFAGVLQKCLFSDNCTTESYAGQTLQQLIDGYMTALGPELDRVYQEIHDKAPHARIIVAGYPQLFPASRAEQTCGKLAQHNVPLTNFGEGWSTTEQNFLRDRDVDLNSLIADHVHQMSFAAPDGVSALGKITFVPVADLFAGHEVCGTKGEWINGPTGTFTHLSHIKKLDFINDQSFHPTDNGQQLGYAAAINHVLNPAN